MRYLTAALIVATLPLIGFAQPAPPAAPSGVFGIDLGRDIDPLAAARDGVKWARITADWSAVQPTRGAFVWKDLDAAVDQSSRAGLRLVLVLANTPKWAALDPQAPEDVWKHQAPRQVADWQRFVETAAAHYRGRVAAWQIEPALDLAVFRGTVPDYLSMLHAARLALRRADPQALVVATSPPGLDLAYVKAAIARAGDDFDALVLLPRGKSAEDTAEALTAIRSRIVTDIRHALWLVDEGTTAAAGGPEAPESDLMAKMAAVALAGGAAHVFWSGHAAFPARTPARQTIAKMLDGARLVGWLPRGPGAYVFVMTGGDGALAVAWSTNGAQTALLATGSGGLRLSTSTGAAAQASGAGAGAGQVPVALGASPVFVQGVGQTSVAEATQAAHEGAFRIPRDAAHDFSRADDVSVVLGSRNVERGLYNQRFRSLPSGAVVPVTIDGVDAVQTDARKDAVYVYLDVDHSYAYFLDGRETVTVTVQVHRAGAPQQIGFNLMYDSTTGYRFTPWQWIDAGSGWATYTVRLLDADFSSAWGWDLAVNGAGDKKAPLVVRSVAVRRMPRGTGRLNAPPAHG